jgi:membrane protease subunit (stomatin/prohibitin family)
MGLIQAGLGAVGGVLADQWKEFFYCEAMPKEVLVTKGVKRVGGRSSNTKGSDNIISNGSGIAVADGQCMMIVEQGKVVEVCAEPGEFTYDKSSEPSIFTGNLGDSLRETFKQIGRRFTYGGDTGKDQRVYYFNTKELIDNLFGTATPIPFSITDNKTGFVLETRVKCSGTYSYKIADPLRFYTNVCANVSDEYRREELDHMLKSEFISALMPSFGKLAAMGILPSQLIGHTVELEEALNETLSKKWSELRGLKVVTVNFTNVDIPDEDRKRLQEYQNDIMYNNGAAARGGMIRGMKEGIVGAANNPNGAMTGFIGMNGMMNTGMNMMGAMGGMGAFNEQPYQTADSWKCACGATVTGNFCPQCGAKKPAPAPADGWKCPKCGATATGKFCPECGTAKPAEDGWTCSCGAVNKGKFCTQCGAKKPAGAPLYKCDKCGWEPEDPQNPPKFCPQCGDPFNTDDAIG